MRLRPLPGPESGQVFSALMAEVVDYLAVWSPLEHDLRAWKRLSTESREWVESRWFMGASDLSALAGMPHEVRMTLRDNAGVDRDHPGCLVHQLDAIGMTPTGRPIPSDRPSTRPELIWAFINWPFDWMDGEPPGDGGDKDWRWLFNRHKDYLRERHKEYLLGTEPPDLTLADIDLSILECVRQLKRDLILRPAVPIPSGSTRHAGDRTDTRPTDQESEEPKADLVTLDQAAAMVHRAKRTLERYKTRGELPDPATEGGGGRAALYDWNTMRPWLTRTFGIELPATFPRNRDH